MPCEFTSKPLPSSSISATRHRPLPDHHPDGGGAGMFLAVVQRLLHHAVDAGLRGVRKLVGDAFLHEFAGDLVAPREFFQLELQRRGTGQDRPAAPAAAAAKYCARSARSVRPGRGRGAAARGPPRAAPAAAACAREISICSSASDWPISSCSSRESRRRPSSSTSSSRAESCCNSRLRLLHFGEMRLRPPLQGFGMAQAQPRHRQPQQQAEDQG